MADLVRAPRSSHHLAERKLYVQALLSPVTQASLCSRVILMRSLVCSGKNWVTALVSQATPWKNNASGSDVGVETNNRRQNRTSGIQKSVIEHTSSPRRDCRWRSNSLASTVSGAWKLRLGHERRRRQRIVYKLVVREQSKSILTDKHVILEDLSLSGEYSQCYISSNNSEDVKRDRKALHRHK